MIMDSQTEFSVKQQVLTSQAGANIIDLLQSGRDIGNGNDFKLESLITSAMIGSGTVQVDLQTSDDPAFGSFTTVSTLGVYAAASPAGTKFLKHIPIVQMKRYLRLFYTVSTANTGGNFSGFIVIDAQASEQYPVNYTIQ